MANTVFKGFWSKEWQEKYHIPKGFLLIKIENIYHRTLGKVLNKLSDWQNKKQELRELKINLEIHYKKRSLEANNLMWALYTIEANEQNAGMKGSRNQMITPEDLYEADLKEHAQIVKIIVPTFQVQFIKREYRIMKEEIIGENTELYVQISTSHLDTRQMSEWIEMQFNRLAEYGVSVTNPGQIQNYWIEWKQYLNDQQVFLYEENMTREEYKVLNPLCEAHGSDCYLGNGEGHLHHINTKGMGRYDIEKAGEKEYPSNWLHLCAEAHNEFHNKGIDEFIRLYPHLKYKILTALKRDFPIEEIEENSIEELDIF